MQLLIAGAETLKMQRAKTTYDIEVGQTRESWKKVKSRKQVSDRLVCCLNVTTIQTSGKISQAMRG